MSAIASEDSIVLELNQKAFNLVVRDRLRRDQDAVVNLIYESVPGMYRHFTRNQLQLVALTLFQEQTYYRNQFIVRQEPPGCAGLAAREGT